MKKRNLFAELLEGFKALALQSRSKRPQGTSKDRLRRASQLRQTISPTEVSIAEIDQAIEQGRK